MKKDIQSTYTNNLNSSGTLTLKDLKRAIKSIEEYSKKPFSVCILSRLSSIKLLKKSAETRNFFWGGGVPVHQDKNVPKDVFRLLMSDSTYQDIPITNKARLLLEKKKSPKKKPLKD